MEDAYSIRNLFDDEAKKYIKENHTENIKRIEETFYNDLYNIYVKSLIDKQYYACYSLLFDFEELYKYDDYIIVCDLIGRTNATTYSSNYTEDDEDKICQLLNYIVHSKALTIDELYDKYKEEGYKEDNEEYDKILCIVRELDREFMSKDFNKNLFKIFNVDDLKEWKKYYSKF